MPSRGNAFNEVKGLLGRLDRSIDEARAKRLGDDEPETPTPAPHRLQGDDQLDAYIGGRDDASTAQREETSEPSPRPAEPEPSPSANRSKYGRAKPLRRPPAGGADPSGIWAE